MGLSQIESQNPSSVEATSIQEVSTLLYVLGLTYVLLQGHLFGVDWLGPVSIQEDDGSVHVNDLPDYLSDEEIQILWQNVTVASETLSEECMLHSSAIAKHYMSWPGLIKSLFDKRTGMA